MCLLISSMKRRRKGCCTRWSCCGKLAEEGCSKVPFLRRKHTPPPRHFFWCPMTRILNSFCIMASVANSRLLSGFLDYLRIEKGLAPFFISAYTTDIGQFAQFLEKRKRLL